MTVFKVAQADWNETSPDSPAYIKNKPSSIGEGGTSEIPHFDLAALGLADPDDTPARYSYISTDTSELMAALAKGPVKFSILRAGKVEEHIVTGSYRPTRDSLQVPWYVYLTPHMSVPRTYTYAIFDGAILCVSGRDKVPGVTFTDDGKVLAIDDGEWVLQDPVVGSLKADILPKTKMTLSSVIQPFGVFGATETGWFKLKEGETYNIEWDTLAEEARAYKAFTYSQDGYEAVVLGNRSYLQGETDIVQDPFIIYYIPANNYCVVMSTHDTSAQEHTFRIYQDNLQKLDEKYLSIIDNPNSLEELFSEVLLLSYNDYFNAYCHTINYALFNIVDQQSYTIEWRDKQYQRTSFAFTAADGTSCVGIGNTLVSGGENNGDEFAIVHDYTNNLLHFLSLDEDAYHKVKVYRNVQATIKSEYLPSMPHFNLYEMGLGDPVGHHNSMSLIEGNATEIITALEKGPVKFSFMYNGDLKTCIMNGEYSVAMDVWFCRTLINNNVLFNLWFFGVTICCTYNELESVLPDIGTSDNGKVLTVKDGVWSAQDAPTSLPEITTQDEGKVLTVKNGEWTVSEGLSLQETLLENTFYFSVSDQSGLYAEIGELLYPDTLFLSKNEVYQVVWDGVEYSCVSSLQSFGVATGIAIGNLGLLGLGELTDEPFIIGATSNGLAMCYTSSTEETHTIRIYQETKPSMSWNDLTDRPFYLGDGTVTEILPATTLPFDFSDGDGFYMFSTPPTSEQMALWNSDWAKAIITWGDVEYECEPKSLMGMKGIGNADMLVGTGDTGEPFVMFLVTEELMGANMIILYDLESMPTEDGAPTVMRNTAISMVSYDIHTLDPKFLGDVPWNKVSDAPFGELSEGTVVGEWTGVYEDADFGIFLSAPETPDLHPDAKMIIEGAIYSVEINGVTYEGIGVSSEMLKQNIASNMIAQSTDVGIAIYKDGSLWGAMATIQNLLWSIVPISTEGYVHNELYPVKITVVEAVKKLDAKYFAPFEYTNGLVEFLPESTITTFMNDDYGVYFNGLPVTQDMYERWQANTESVQVTFDGIVYNCIPQLVNGYYGVGNGAPFGGAGNGEPFVVTVVNEDGNYYLAMLALTDTTNTNHTLSVSVMGRTFILREEYLPKDAIKACIDEYIGDILGGDY